MACCEKCWTDAFTRSMCDRSKSQTEHYQDLLQERDSNPCTPQEQAGELWNKESVNYPPLKEWACRSRRRQL